MLRLVEKTAHPWLFPGSKLQVTQVAPLPETASHVDYRNIFFSGICHNGPNEGLVISFQLEFTRKDADQHVLLPIQFYLRQQEESPHRLNICFDDEEELLNITITEWDLRKNRISMVNTPPVK